MIWAKNTSIWRKQFGPAACVFCSENKVSHYTRHMHLVTASRAVPNEIRMRIKILTFEKHREHKTTPHRENPGNRLIHSRLKQFFGARHERHTTRIARKPRRLCPDGLPLLTSLAFVRTVRARRDRSEKVPKFRQEKYTYLVLSTASFPWYFECMCCLQLVNHEFWMKLTHLLWCHVSAYIRGARQRWYRQVRQLRCDAHFCRKYDIMLFPGAKSYPV